METNNQKLQNEELNEDLSEQELDEVSGGIIVVGGKNVAQNLVSHKINQVSLNPQPLPPCDPLKIIH